jgi:four helix bundle protein
LTPGHRHEATQAEALLEHAVGPVCVADAGYDADRIVAAIEARGMKAVIPPNPTRRRRRRYDNLAFVATTNICATDLGSRLPSANGRASRSAMNTPDDEAKFNFQKLDVYQRAIEFLAIAMTIIDALPRGSGALADQFKRAALSIPLNIAESQGRPSPGQAARAYAIARGSAMECAAILDAAKVMGGLDDAKATQARLVLLRIVQMLSKMCR